MSETAVCALEDLGVLSLRGQDVRRFLQGQLSNDLDQLAPGSLLRAGLHNPQGRTLALLALLTGGNEEVLAVLPRELLALTLATLRRYVLRARVQIADVSDAYRLYGLAAATAGSVPPGGIDVAYDYEAQGTRRLQVLPASAVPPRGAPLPRAAWRLQDVAAALPQLYVATSGQFVAQMINLDCIGAVSFSKGCYTGQEVIARAHYRGRVKRRMQRFFSAGAPLLAAGDAGQLSDGRAFRVVEAAARADGVEFLAVAARPGAGSGASSEFPQSDAAVAARAAGASPLEVHPLPLPYALPE
jgi:hypothetical protein